MPPDISIVTDDDQTCIRSLFDAAGNQLRTANLSSIEWDWEGQISSISYTDPDDPSATVSEYFVYAPGGGQRARKVRETVNTEGLVTKLAITDYLGNTERRAEYVQADPAVSIGYDGETVSNAVPQKDYSELRVRLGHAQSARLLLGKLSAEGPQDESKSYFDLSSHTDSVQMELDESGAISSHQAYYPFGGTAASADGKDQTGLDLKHYQYSGQEKDASGLYCYGYRYYDPSAFRWTRPDPAGAAGSGFNWYAMVSNNPVTHRDVMGLMYEELERAHFLASRFTTPGISSTGPGLRSIGRRPQRFRLAKFVGELLGPAPIYDFKSDPADLYIIAEWHKHSFDSMLFGLELKSWGVVDDVFKENDFLGKVELLPEERLEWPTKRISEHYQFLEAHSHVLRHDLPKSTRMVGNQIVKENMKIYDRDLRRFRDIKLRGRKYMTAQKHVIHSRSPRIVDLLLEYASEALLELEGAWKKHFEADELMLSMRFMWLLIEDALGGGGSFAVTLGSAHTIRPFATIRFGREFRCDAPMHYYRRHSMVDFFFEAQLWHRLNKTRNMNLRTRILVPQETMGSLRWAHNLEDDYDFRPLRITGPYRFGNAQYYHEKREVKKFWEIETAYTAGGRDRIARPLKSESSNNENNPSNTRRQSYRE